MGAKHPKSLVPIIYVKTGWVKQKSDKRSLLSTNFFFMNFKGMDFFNILVYSIFLNSHVMLSRKINETFPRQNCKWKNKQKCDNRQLLSNTNRPTNLVSWLKK